MSLNETGTDRPPGPDGWPLLGITPHYARDPFGSIERWHERYGDVVHLPFPVSPVCMVTDPDLIEQVLVTDSDRYVRGAMTERVFGDLEEEAISVSEGEQWRRQRQLLQPVFSRDRITEYARVMVDYADDLADEWSEGDEVDVGDASSELTLRILAKALFDLDVREEAPVIREAANALVAKADFGSKDAYLPDWMPTKTNRRFRRATTGLHELIEELIDERQAELERGGASDDVLARLLTAGTEDGEIALSREEVRDNMIALLLAGHDTSATALTYAWFLLANHPRAKEALHDELEAVLGGGRPSPEDVFALEYTEAVVRETLRLYPPSFAVLREPTEDVRIGDHHVRAGTTVMCPQWILHRDGRYFEYPHEFRPDRWIADGDRPGIADEIPEYAYFPFGGGPRHCLGMRFAMMELQLVLATMAQQVDLELLSPEEPTPSASITTRPREAIRMRVHERD